MDTIINTAANNLDPMNDAVGVEQRLETLAHIHSAYLRAQRSDEELRSDLYWVRSGEVLLW